jgi:FHA domain
VILSDAGVARHHCIITSQDGKLSIRAMDDAVTLNERRLAPGQTAALEIGTLLTIGAAELAIGDDAAVANRARHEARIGRYTKMAKRSMQSTADMFHRFRWSFIAVLPLAVAVASVLSPSRQVPAQPVKPAAPIEAGRPGTEIARDVAEVLRLSGIASEATYNGTGTVTVRGRLGNQQALARVIDSRAMHDIVGLKRVVVLNLDHPGELVTGVDGTRIVSAVSGDDPYVVTADGSRYYVGASLPQGGKLSGVQGTEVLIAHDGRVERLQLSGARPGR